MVMPNNSIIDGTGATTATTHQELAPADTTDTPSLVHSPLAPVSITDPARQRFFEQFGLARWLTESRRLAICTIRRLNQSKCLQRFGCCRHNMALALRADSNLVRDQPS